MISPGRPSGVYIHVPFCDKLCRFCPFNKQATDEELVQRYLDALLVEIDLYSQSSHDADLRFVYLGGGTPSVLSAKGIARVLDRLAQRFGLSGNAEVTLECHPTHLTQESARSMRDAGVTRLSTGVQSWDDTVLAKVGAQHRVQDAYRAVNAAATTFGELGVDLLYRCPQQTLGQWGEQLERTLAMQEITHISCYSLVLPNSSVQPSEREDAAMAVLATEMLEDRGFAHYASCASGGFDFARPGRQCHYEVEHWAAPQAEFLGLGPGAFGFVGSAMTVNTLRLSTYCELLESKRQLPLVSVTPMPSGEAMRRYFVIGVKALRVELEPFRRLFKAEPEVVFADEFRLLLSQGLATINDDALVLSEVGRFYVDSISSLFFSKAERDVPHPEEPEIRMLERSLAATGPAAGVV
jgi:oxygen-independent coproporphyrinogen-3 oxidase